MLFLITSKTITALTGGDSITMFDYGHAPNVLMQRGYLLPSVSLLDSTGNQEQQTQLTQLPSSEFCH